MVIEDYNEGGSVADLKFSNEMPTSILKLNPAVYLMRRGLFPHDIQEEKFSTLSCLFKTYSPSLSGSLYQSLDKCLAYAKGKQTHTRDFLVYTILPLLRGTPVFRPKQ